MSEEQLRQRVAALEVEVLRHLDDLACVVGERDELEKALERERAISKQYRELAETRLKERDDALRDVTRLASDADELRETHRILNEAMDVIHDRTGVIGSGITAVLESISVEEIENGIDAICVYGEEERDGALVKALDRVVELKRELAAWTPPLDQLGRRDVTPEKLIGDAMEAMVELNSKVGKETPRAVSLACLRVVMLVYRLARVTAGGAR